MSRTTRNREESFESYYRVFLENGWWDKYYGEGTLARKRAQYYSRTEKWHSRTLPRFFRNSVNRKRRRHDRHEIWKAVNLNDYPEQCSHWNCKDNNAWGYW